MSQSTEVVWYHGTRRGFTRGGVLFPRTFHGQSPTTAPTNPGMTPSPDSGEWVYITTDVNLAWVYAFHARGRGAPKVLTVTPRGTVERDPEHSPETAAYRCPWAAVTGVSKVPTMTEAEARNGWLSEQCDSEDSGWTPPKDTPVAS